MCLLLDEFFIVVQICTHLTLGFKTNLFTPIKVVSRSCQTYSSAFKTFKQNITPLDSLIPAKVVEIKCSFMTILRKNLIDISNVNKALLCAHAYYSRLLNACFCHLGQSKLNTWTERHGCIHFKDLWNACRWFRRGTRWHERLLCWNKRFRFLLIKVCQSRGLRISMYHLRSRVIVWNNKDNKRLFWTQASFET